MVQGTGDGGAAAGEALQQCQLIQNMIDISVSSLQGLRTKCAASNDLTQHEIRTLEVTARSRCRLALGQNVKQNFVENFRCLTIFVCISKMKHLKTQNNPKYTSQGAVLQFGVNRLAFSSVKSQLLDWFVCLSLTLPPKYISVGGS